jgi:hypothetical protein
MSERISVMVAERSAVRRKLRAACQAVRERDFRLVSERVLDLSTEGALLACDRRVAVGDALLLSVRLPDGCYVDAEGLVVRVLEGWRYGDLGYCAGLRFTALDAAGWLAIRDALRGLPPPVPQRPLRVVPLFDLS